VKLNEDWTLGAYQDGPSAPQIGLQTPTRISAVQTSFTPSSYSAGQLSSPSRSTPVLSAPASKSPAKKQKSPYKASPSGALPSFASTYNQPAPSPVRCRSIPP
jgi:hypothetical protein